MKKIITASMLYNLIQCPHRVTMDLFEDPALKDPVNPFVQLLWERGNTFEKEVMDGLDVPYTDLHEYYGEEKKRLTLNAMTRGDELIYSGRITIGDLVGEPDILRKQGAGYVAGDIKSGAGEEGGSENLDAKPKKHYAVQLALYTDIIERLGFAAERAPFIWDIHGREIVYDLDAPQGPRKPWSMWDEYEAALETVCCLLDQTENTLPAYGSKCKLCHWYTSCGRRLEEADDLTLIPELGRARRDAMMHHLCTIRDLAHADLETFIRGNKTDFPGVGPDTLRKFQNRAKLQKQPGAKPYLKETAHLPESDTELFFDIETDPMRDICYLHGFIERRDGDNRTEIYVAFLAEKPSGKEEERAFAEAWAYIQNSQPCVIYYYSAYERTIWRKLQKKYPHVITVDELENLFDPADAVDLYHHIVRSKTEWPTRDFSIKTLASYLGFSWRDSNPSGAASIEWYHRWTESGDPEIRQRILDYNEDDCIAMRVLLEGIQKLPVKKD
ncbi:MAG: TM0106 family RecB-like putative nuclease [Deltaproteobacteria bacterium]|nr:TM0106 family RecB-like putative nuclease [Deltaproteobacteria bacterium]